VVPSLELLIGVAVGGRATLVGAVLGTIVGNYAKTGLSEQFASGWLYLQGALFIAVVAFAPKGLAGLADLVRRQRAAPAGRRAAADLPAEALPGPALEPAS
jgi:urea transport system permease protein